MGNENTNPKTNSKILYYFLGIISPDEAVHYNTGTGGTP